MRRQGPHGGGAGDGSRCDCLTDTHAVEFDFGHKWAKATARPIIDHRHLVPLKPTARRTQAGKSQVKGMLAYMVRPSRQVVGALGQ